MNKTFRATAICLGILLALFLKPVSAEVPQVKIRVAQYEKTLEFAMPDGGTWVSGKKSGKIQPGKLYRIDGTIKAKALRRYHLMVGSTGINKPELLNAIEKKFEAFKTHRFQAGALPSFGYPDNRIVFVGVGIFENETQACEQQNKLATDNISSWVFIENIKLATGHIKLTTGKQTLINSTSGIQLVANKFTTLKKAEFAKGYSWHGFEDRHFAEKLTINWGAEDLLDCVEHTDLEKLIIGIVPSEISAKAPPAALQAQAVAARGEMLSKKGVRHLNEGYDFCSEQHCQVYKGIQATDKAIAASIRCTRGQLMQNHEGGILDAVYGANCGGHSSANHSIWTSNPDPHLQGVSDCITQSEIDLTDEKTAANFVLSPPACWCSTANVEGADKFRWKKVLNSADWHKVEAAAAIGRIKEIGSFIREVSGRIISMKITGENGEKTILKELPIRQLLGGLRSSFFTVIWQRDPSGFITGAEFSGAGWGHGVGMCQTGAQSMALAGHKFNTILAHYYPGAKLKKLY